MPPVIVGIAAGVAAAGVVSTAAAIAIGIGAAALTYAATPKFDGGSFANEAFSQQQMLRSPVEPRRGIYGRAMVSGPLVFAEETGTDNAYLHLVIPLAGHRCDGVEKIYFGDEVAWANGALTSKYASVARLKIHLGNQTTSDPDLTAECSQWTNAHVGFGVTYLYARLKFDTKVFPNGVPNIKALVRGKQVFDPRNANHDWEQPTTWTWSDNWALCCLDYNRFESGVGAAAHEIDLSYFAAAANDSDQLVEYQAGKFEKRYTCNGTYNQDVSPSSIMEKMLTAGAGMHVYVSGQYRLYAGVYQGPEVLVLTEDDAAGDIDVRPYTPRAELCNAVRGTFVDPENFYQPTDFPPYESSYYRAQDDGEYIDHDLDLPFTQSVWTAQRLGKLYLEQKRAGMQISMPIKMIGVAVSVGKVVGLSLPRLGIDGTFQVVDWQFDYGKPVSLILVETSPELFDYAMGSYTERDLTPNVILPNPATVPTPVGLQYVEYQDDPQWQGELTWNAPANNSSYRYVIEVSNGLGEVIYQTNADATRLLLPKFDTGFYTVSVWALNLFANRSNVPATLTIGATLPAPVTGIEVIAGPLTLTLRPTTAAAIAQTTQFEVLGGLSNNIVDAAVIGTGKEAVWPDRHANTAYHVWARTVNNYGVSSWYGPVVATTSADNSSIIDLIGNTFKSYTWFAWADDASGTGFTTVEALGDGKAYMGIATDKDSASPSGNWQEYTWTKIHPDIPPVFTPEEETKLDNLMAGKLPFAPDKDMLAAQDALNNPALANNLITALSLLNQGINAPALGGETPSGAQSKASSAQSAAIAAAATDATTKANNAKAAAESYALAKANLAETTAKAYADGIVSDEEARAIADAQAKADAAKAAAIAAAAADATSKANNAKAQAEANAALDALNKANTAKADAISTAASDATTKANNAKAAAESYALAKANLAETTAKAYADGIVSDEEARAIADAQAKANAAQSAAIAAAAADATSKANNAKAQAEANAALDALNKANAAKTDAITEALAQSGGNNLLNISTFTSNKNKGGWNTGSVELISSVPGVTPLDGRLYALKLATRDSYEISNLIPVKGGETLYFSAWVNTESCNYSVGFGYRKVVNGVSQSSWYGVVTLGLGNSWTWLQGSIVIPNDCTSIMPWIVINGNSGFGTGFVQDLVISRSPIKAGALAVRDSLSASEVGADPVGSAASAQSAAIAAAAADATSKANNAKSQAEANAALDALNKANTAKADAISTASTDATTKANNAKTQAISSAATDATTKANSAQSAAIAAAAADAASKDASLLNQALSLSVSREAFEFYFHYRSAVILLIPYAQVGDYYQESEVIGQLTFRRGGVGTTNRTERLDIAVKSAYNTTNASLAKLEVSWNWKLVACNYKGKKWLALDAKGNIQDARIEFWGRRTIGSIADYDSSDQFKVIDYYRSGEPNFGTGVINDEIYSSMVEITPQSSRNASGTPLENVTDSQVKATNAELNAVNTVALGNFIANIGLISTLIADTGLFNQLQSRLGVFGGLTANSIAALAIATNHLQAGAVTVDKVSANAITAEKIAALAIATNHLQAGSVTVDKVSANAITAEKIAALAIATNHLQAGAVTSDKITADTALIQKLIANVGLFNQLQAQLGVFGGLGANSIAANSITTKHLTIANTDNICTNPKFANGSNEGWTSNVTVLSTSSTAEWGSNYIGLINNYRDTYFNYGKPFNVQHGDSYFISCYAYHYLNPNSDFRLGFQVSYSDGSVNWLTFLARSASDRGGINFASGTIKTLDVSGKKIVSAMLFLQMLGTTGAMGGGYYFSNVYLRKMASSELIVDGAVTTQKILSKAITTDKIAANAVTATEVLADTALINKLVATSALFDSLVARLAVFGGLTANSIASDAILGRHIKAGEKITSPIIEGGEVRLIGTNAMKIESATPFGPDNLVYWRGPRLLVGGNPDWANIRKSNATRWTDAAGDEYFGGSLSAGVLKTGVTNPDKNPYAASSYPVTIGPFGSNGKAKNVVISFALSAVSQSSSNPGSTTQPQLSWQLQRKIGSGSWGTVSSGVFNGAVTAFYEGEAPAHWEVDEHCNGSFTFTDNTLSTSDFNYRVLVVSYTRFHITSNVIGQTLTLVSTEQ
jgi:hypothetical protein